MTASNPLQYEAADLSRLLAEDIERVVEALAISVRRRSRRRLYAFAPWAGDREAKLEIELYPRPGKWNHWTGGVWGDAFDLVARTLGSGTRDRKAAYAWALSHLGLATAPDAESKAEWVRRKREAAERAAERQRAAEAKLLDQRTRAQAAWLAAAPIAPGDPADLYLRARGIDLSLLPRLPRAVRFSPREPWFDDDGVIAHEGPALCSAMTLPGGRFGSLHRIWIDPARPGEKADLEPPRKMWPSSEGAVIRLWRGASGLSEADALKRTAGAPAETVVVCEGVEDGLSIALMTPELRVIAAGSLPGLLAMPAPASARQVVVAADNDWGKPQAAALLERACRRLSEELGLAVRVARSPAGKDFNDLLRGRE